MTCKPWFGCGLAIQIKRPPPPSTADIEASTSETRSKIAAGFVSAAFSCGATKPFCANLNTGSFDLLLEILVGGLPIDLAERFDRGRIEDFAEGEDRRQIGFSAFSKLRFQLRHEIRRGRVDGYTKISQRRKPSFESRLRAIYSWPSRSSFIRQSSMSDLQLGKIRDFSLPAGVREVRPFLDLRVVIIFAIPFGDFSRGREPDFAVAFRVADKFPQQQRAKRPAADETDDCPTS